MRRRRRRFFRDDVVAPWAAMAVIVGFWWLSALVIGRGATPADSPVLAMIPPASAPSKSVPSNPPPPTARAVVAPEGAGLAASDASRVTISEDVAADVRALRQKDLLVPVNGMKASSLHSTFGDPRGPTRGHEALDILAPRGTPVVAATDGRIVKLFTSVLGGLTVYQFDVEERYCYYYAHLDAYAPGLREGEKVTRGQLLGYVGTTGNAPAGAPHLHFAIYRLSDAKQWWAGTALNPYPIFR